MNRKPAAFMSYVRKDDSYGRLSEFRRALSEEARLMIGEEFPIFQDKDDIQWGENWRERIEESLDAVTFLIPIITPAFFRSSACREELQRFIDREKELNRTDLILPVYYADSTLFNDKEKRKSDELARVLATRQHADWRELRLEPLTSPQAGKTLARLATRLRDALERVREKRAAPSQDRQDRRRSLHPDSDTRPQQSQGAEPGGKGDETAQPTEKTEPPTRVVDPLHRGDHATITAAIKAAKPGDRILVRPGLYQEGLVVDKPLEIIGEGNLDEVVVQAAGQAALLFKTTMGRVTNLTLRQAGSGEWYGVDVAQGRLELEGCDISSRSLACVAIHGGADPRLHRNRIHDGKAAGVYVYDGGGGTLEGNDVFGNANSGVAIRGEGSDPTLRNNRIHKNRYEAVWVYEGGGGTIEDNDLRDNERGAWDVSDDSAQSLKRARNQE